MRPTTSKDTQLWCTRPLASPEQKFLLKLVLIATNLATNTGNLKAPLSKKMCHLLCEYCDYCGHFGYFSIKCPEFPSV